MKLSSILMIISLTWLTISAPFVFEAKQYAIASMSFDFSPSDIDVEDCNPIGSTNEEKAPSGSTLSMTEEYLHHNDELYHEAELSRSHARCRPVSEYVAFHGELISPPPDTFLS